MARQTTPKSDSTVAVLTGDIIASTKLSIQHRSEVSSLLVEANAIAGQAIPGGLPYAPDFFRGDGWQLLVADPSEALRTALIIRAFLLSDSVGAGFRTDSRIGIGIGLAGKLNRTKISESVGPAFDASGRALDLSEDSRFNLVLRCPGVESCSEEAIDRILELIDVLVIRWTDKQAAAVLGKLRGLNQEQIGADWFEGRISQAAVGSHLEKAGWHALSRCLKWFKNSVPALKNNP